MGKPKDASTRWVTRERPKIDRIACPWLVARFIDPVAEFLYVPPKDVLRDAQARDGAVRRAVRVVQGRAGRDPHLEPGGLSLKLSRQGAKAAKKFMI